jgi:hypothetical protein
MDPNLKKARKELSEKYPPEIGKIWTAANNKAREIRHQNAQADIKKVIILEIKTLVGLDGSPNNELIERLINIEKESD